jgi:glycosyltransferase involved in cell wall biosynthesis
MYSRASARESEGQIGSAAGLRLAYVIGTYPSLTTTFIDREVNSLREQNVCPAIISIRRPSGPLSQDQEELRKLVTYLLPVEIWRFVAAHLHFALWRPTRYFRTLLYLLGRPHPGSRTRLRTFLHFAEGVVAARLLDNIGCTHVHAHFVDRAATVAIVASRLLGVTYSVTAHANDIYVKPVLLAEKVGGAAFTVTCTSFNKTYLERLLGNETGRNIHCIYHGLDICKYQPAARGQADRPILLSVGQLKEKKGFFCLVKACQILKESGADFECWIVGEGPLRGALTKQIDELGLRGIVHLRGSLPHEDVVECYRRASMFVLPCVVGGDGDRDGIPNVILEAMAMQLPVVSTRHSGIPEAVENGVSGLLLPPGDDVALAAAIGLLLANPADTNRLGKAGRLTVTQRFSVDSNVKLLLQLFLGSSATPSPFVGHAIGN